MKFPFSTKSQVSNYASNIDIAVLNNNRVILGGWLDDKQLESCYLIIENEAGAIFKVGLTDCLRLPREDVAMHLGKQGEGYKYGFFTMLDFRAQQGDKLKAYFKASNKIFGEKNFYLKQYSTEELTSLLKQHTNKNFVKVESYLTSATKSFLGSAPKKTVKTESARCAFYADKLYATSTSVFAAGWFADPDSEVANLEIRFKQEVVFSNIHTQWVVTKRKDVQEHFGKDDILITEDCGFIWGATSHKAKLKSSNDYTLVFLDESGSVLKEQQLQFTFENQDLKTTTQNIFSLFPVSHPKLYKIYDEFVGPFIQSVQDNWLVESDKTVKYFGNIIKNPKVSIIIPLYGRWDFLNYQLALFANDSAFEQYELIYVVDDPSIYESVINHAKAVHPIFQVPFKVVYGNGNFGYAKANNLGASEANGQFVLLLNSDVIPIKKGWLAEMVSFYESTEDCGIVGPRLLYDDNSLQHEGMAFERNDFLEGFWFNMHPAKGQPKWLYNADRTPKEVEAVTGACMLMKNELYQKAGGLNESYLQGDFEDSDLNLQIRAMGLKPYLMPNVELYHLERKSQSLFSNSDWKLKLTLYNAWQHTKKWNQDILNLKAVSSE